MSTNYELLNTEEAYIDLTEHSGKFDLEVGVGLNEPRWTALDDLTLCQLKELNQQITNVISYHDPRYESCEVDYS